MVQLTVGEFKAQFSQVLNDVLHGEEVEVLYGRTKKPVARLSPIQKERPPRKLGILEGIAGFTEVAEGKISMEEFLSMVPTPSADVGQEET